VHFERSGPNWTTAALTKFGSIWFGVLKSGNRESAEKTFALTGPKVLVVEYAVEVLTVEVMTVNWVPSSRLF